MAVGASTALSDVLDCLYFAASFNSLSATGDTGRPSTAPPPSAPTSGDLSRHNNS